jgi:hypothetical protein
MSGASLSVPGVLHLGASEQDLAVLHVGPAVGWVALRGIHTWSREISIALKADISETVCRELEVTLPEAQPAAAQLANAKRAALASNLVEVDPSLVDSLVAKGVRVHTVGSDQITGGFFYFAKGGTGEAVRVQGNVVEMIAPALAASADNAAVEACLDGLIARVLAELSDGMLSEAQIELAATLPALGDQASDATAKLQTLEGFLVLIGSRAAKYEERARAVVETLGQAGRRGEDTVQVPLFGDARSVVQPEIEIEYAEGESGARQKLTLPERRRWAVVGLLSETMPPPAAEPKAADEKAAADRIAAEKAAAEQAAAERAAAAEKAAAERAAQQEAAADKAAAERAAIELAAAEKRAADEKAAETAAAERVAAEKLAEERAAAERARTRERAAVKRADEQALAEKAAAEKKAASRAAEKPVASKASKEKAAATAGARAKPSTAALTKSGDGKAKPETDTTPTPTWMWIVLLLAVVAGAYYFAFVRGHG